MGFFDKAKAAAEQATAKAKEGVEDVQAKRELSQSYSELGKIAFELVESKAISHPRLESLAAKIRGLIDRDAADGAADSGAAAGNGTAGDAADTEQPATPS
jgi:cell pole-organizing protein PopZ